MPRHKFRIGDNVKLIFAQGTNTERMWVIVKRQLSDGRYSGTLNSDPLIVDLCAGDTVRFSADQVIDVWR